MKKVKVADWSELEPVTPAYALVANVDLVVIRWRDEDKVSVLYGRCLHRGALLSDGHVEGENLICGLHDWDYRYTTGISKYNNEEQLARFEAWIEKGAVWVDEDEISAWERENPQSYHREAYQGLYADLKGTPAEPHTNYIQQLAADGLSKTGHHGPVSAMGVPGPELPGWNDLQLLTAQPRISIGSLIWGPL